jgi:hypothetical protein
MKRASRELMAAATPSAVVGATKKLFRKAAARCMAHVSARTATQNSRWLLSQFFVTFVNSVQENAMNELNLSPVPQADRVFSLSTLSAPTSVSTTDGLVRTESHRFEERLAAVRNEAREQGVEGSCGGVGGGWGN